MNNYVPDSDQDRERIIKANPLYKEIFERRSLCSCFDCDYTKARARGECPSVCEGCMHKDETGVEMKSLKGFSVAREHKIKIRHLPFGKCPVCGKTKREWIGIVSTYFSKDGILKVADFDAKFCPWCGNEHVRKKVDIKQEISFSGKDKDDY